MFRVINSNFFLSIYLIVKNLNLYCYCRAKFPLYLSSQLYFPSVRLFEHLNFPSIELNDDRRLVFIVCLSSMRTRKLAISTTTTTTRNLSLISDCNNTTHLLVLYLA